MIRKDEEKSSTSSSDVINSHADSADSADSAASERSVLELSSDDREHHQLLGSAKDQSSALTRVRLRMEPCSFMRPTVSRSCTQFSTKSTTQKGQQYPPD